MFSKGFKIVKPRRFDIYIDDLRCKDDEAIVKIEQATICKADLRYYLGKRDERVLGLKYPMNLLHESVGTIVRDGTGTFGIGDRVMLVPNLVEKKCDEGCVYKVCQKDRLGENYCPYAKFASSNYNGFSREFVTYPVDNLILIPENLANRLAVFGELISVACAIYRRVDIFYDQTVAIWGDGILGYILCSVLNQLHNGKIIAVGKHQKKLDEFPADEVFLVEDKGILSKNIDTAFECVGGRNSEGAINEIIDNIKVGGKIVLTGVSENNVEIKTRKILGKGLSLYGVTRSNVDDFKKAIDLFQDKGFREHIAKLILAEVEINNIVDFYNIFEKELHNKSLGRYIMKFNI